MTAKLETRTRVQLLEMAERLAGIGHWRFDLSSGRISWSAETYRIHGLPQTGGEPDYKQLLGLYLPESADLLSSLVERAITTGQGYELEAAIRRPDGAIRYVAAKAECSLAPDGKVESLFGVFQDITESMQAQRFMRALTNHIPAMVAYWDSGLRCRYANLQYREWFGRLPEEMLGVSIQELMGPALFKLNEPFIQGAMSGQAQIFERILTKPSGETGHTLARYIPDLDESGRVMGMVVLVTDITALKETELQLKQATDAAEEALAQTRAALAVKSEFLSNISHELRNPLTGIIGFSEILAQKHSLSDQEASRHIDLIRNASADLLTTVNDLLDFSKLEAGQVAIKLNPVDPYSIGLRALEFFEPQLREKNLSHAFSVSNLPLAIEIDPVRVRQILLNLIGNAVKFTTAGDVSLQADYDSNRKVLRYVVADTGVGIAPEHQSRLFQRFSQVDGSNTRRFGGTGLGLAICKGLAEAMGGRVGFVSAVGEGSQFWVEIPCEPVTTTAPSDRDFIEESERVDVLQGLRLLVADDHPVNRELVRRLVEPLGVVVVEAQGGTDAVALATREPFDTILLDVLMPELDGPTAARMIRSSLGPNRAVPIVAFTADADRPARRKWADLFDDRLSKPFAAVELLNMLVRHSPVRGT